MSKKAIIICVAAAFILLFGHNAFAKDLAGKFGIGAEIAYSKIKDEKIEDVHGQEYTYDGTSMYGANATYFFTDWFSLECGLHYVKTDMAQSATDVSAAWGELTQTPILLTARAHLPNKSVVSPYFGIGGGYYFNDFKPSNILASTFALGTSIDSENSFGFHINGGMEVFMSDNLALDLDLKYVWYSTDFVLERWKFKDRTEHFDLDTFTAGIGFKYYF